MEKCWYCNHPTDFLVGSSEFNHRKKVSLFYGYVCLNCLSKAVTYVMNCCFATKRWPVICKCKRIIWHGYHDAEMLGMSVLSASAEFIATLPTHNNQNAADETGGRREVAV